VYYKIRKANRDAVEQLYLKEPECVMWATYLEERA
jgi:hypothetical protein